MAGTLVQKRSFTWNMTDQAVFNSSVMTNGNLPIQVALYPLYLRQKLTTCCSGVWLLAMVRSAKPAC